jgi:predicted metal-dependent hydrolase
VKNYIGPFLIHLKNENKLSFPDISNIRISNARTKWGSCSSKRVLSFSWRIGMAPVEVINYIICHEMAHLVHLNHSDKFWALVKMIMPDYLEAEKWLKANGHTLDL